MRTLLALLLMSAAAALAETERFELPADQRIGSIRRIFVLPHSHLDIGFTLPPDQVARDYKDSIDIAIRLAREHTDFRWTIESSWMLGEWLRRTEDERLIAELGRLMQEGRISLGAAFGNMHSGLMDTEEMNRLIYLGESFRGRFGIRSEVAFQNDVPGFSWAYPRELAGSGVKYLITGLNLFIGGGNNFGVRHTPFYWIGPDGSRVLTWLSYDSYVEGYRWKLSSGASIEELEKTVPRRLAWLERNGYAYESYLLMDAVGDNGDPMRAHRTLLRIREWNRRHPELPMKMCTGEEFFHEVLEKPGKQLKEAGGDAAGHWELVKLTVPEVASRMRETASLLPAAEAFATITSLLKGSWFPRYDFSDAWRELLAFHEHTASGQPGWPRYFSRWQTDWNNTMHYAAAMSGYSNTRQLFDKAVARLAGSTGLLDPAHKSSQKEASLLVFNGVSWRRGGPVVADNLPSALREGPVEVVDRVSGTVLPSEDVAGTQRHIRFLAPAIPALGYRSFSLRKAALPPNTKADFPIEVKWNEQGWITSIRDRDQGVEMINPNSDRSFGNLYVSRKNRNYELAPVSAPETKTSDGTVTRHTEVTRKGSALHRTKVTVYRDTPYADLEFDVDLAVLDETSARYAIAFPIAVSKQFWLDGAGCVIRIPEDLLPGGEAPQYAPLHFVHFPKNPQVGVTLGNRDAFLFRPNELFLVASESLVAETRDEGKQRLHRTEPRGSNLQTFRFRMGVQNQRVSDWKKFGQEFNLPLQASVVAETDLPAEQSFLSVSHSNVRITAFKPSEFQAGLYVIRFQETNGEAAENVRLTTPFQMSEAEIANTVESASGVKMNLSGFNLKPWQTLTTLVKVQR
jgi:Glycosyl hydrolases family 38 N-terminal domain/Glycosyl hydrolases family 38 C-terminal domain